MKKEFMEEKGRLRKVVHTIGWMDAVITGTILVVICTQMIFAFWSYNYSSGPETVFGKVVPVDKQNIKQQYYHGITGDYVEMKTVGLFLDFVFTLSLFVLLLVDCNLVKATERVSVYLIFYLKFKLSQNKIINVFYANNLLTFFSMWIPSKLKTL